MAKENNDEYFGTVLLSRAAVNERMKDFGYQDAGDCHFLRAHGPPAITHLPCVVNLYT